MGVAGFTPSPTFSPVERILHSSGTTRSPSSTCTVIEFAPAFANASTRISGRLHIRCTSKNNVLLFRKARTVCGPKLRLGTKCPSMMSM